MGKRVASRGHLEPDRGRKDGSRDGLEEIISFLEKDKKGLDREELDDIIDFIASYRFDQTSGAGSLRGR